MNRTQQRKSNQRRRPPSNKPPADLWREPGALPDAQPVRASNDPTALLRSLGEPPIAGGPEALIHFATVSERTAMIAAALARSAGVLATDEA